MSEEKKNVEVTAESTQKKKFELTPKAKKIINIVVDVVCGAVLLFALLLAICTIRSKVKGYNDYTEIFGKAYIAASSESMNADKPDWVPEGKYSGFKKGDLLTIKTLSSSEAAKLEVGDIITFETIEIVKDKRVLNTHRIKEINYRDGAIESYTTQGDNKETSPGTETVRINEVVGIYQGKTGGIGHLFLFMNSSAGFFVCIVLPTLLVVVYCVVNLILVIRKEKKVQTAAATEEKDAERERIRAELLAEMQANSANQETLTDNQATSESNAQPEAIVVAEEVTENKTKTVDVPAPENAAEEVKADTEDTKSEEVKAESEEVKAEDKKAEPAEKKAKPAAKTTAKSATSKTTAKPSSSKSAASKTTAAKSANKSTTTKTAAKPAATKKTSAKTDTDNSKE